MNRLINLGIFILFLNKIIDLLKSLSRPLAPLFYRLIAVIHRYHPCRLCMRCCVRLRKFWQSWQARLQRWIPSWQRLAFNMGIGLFIFFCLQFVPDSRFMHETEDLGIDWVMKMHRDTAPVKEAPPFVLLDIDENTYQKWQEPFLTPRDKLLKLLKFAVEGQPQIIIVDIDLSYPSNHPSKKSLPEHDQNLYEFFAQYEANYCKTKCPHILLARGIKRIKLPQPKHDYFEQRLSFLEEAVANSQHIHWASTLFDLERDNVLRRWHLWKITCTENQPAVLPSMQLLAVALVKNPTAGNIQITSELNKIKLTDCKNAKTMTTPIGHFLLGDLKIHFSPTRLHRRIVYNISYNISQKGVTRPNISWKGVTHHILSTQIVHKITDNNQPIDNEFLQGSITVIGSSYMDSRDIYATPIGRMPGTMVIINAIHSLLQYGELKTLSFWDMLLIQVALIFLMSFVFAYFKNILLGNLISVALIIILMMPLSFLLFKYGVWLNFAITLLILELFQKAIDNRELVNEIRSQRAASQKILPK